MSFTEEVDTLGRLAEVEAAMNDSEFITVEEGDMVLSDVRQALVDDGLMEFQYDGDRHGARFTDDGIAALFVMLYEASLMHKAQDDPRAEAFDAAVAAWGPQFRIAMVLHKLDITREQMAAWTEAAIAADLARSVAEADAEVVAELID